MLLYLLKWVKQNTALKFHILSTRGVLKHEFSKFGRVFLWTKPLKVNPTFHPIKRIFFTIINYIIKFKSSQVLGLFNSYDLIYANTIVSAETAIAIKKKHRNTPKLLVHLHELNTIINISTPNFSNYLKDIDGFIVPSKIVKDNLVKNWSIPSNKVDVVYAFSQLQSIPLDIAPLAKNNYFIVGSSGLAHWRKGDDLFIQIAHYLKKNYPERKIKFVWVGKLSIEQKLIIAADLKKANLEDYVTFVGEQANPIPYYNQFDVFLLPSREDPFPLVCIEVGILGKPIICFKGATGTEEVLKNGGGFIVPYLDTAAVAEKIVHYYDHPDSLKKDGELNRQQFATFTPENQCPKIFSVIEKALNN